MCLRGESNQICDRWFGSGCACGSGEPFTVANAICIHEEDCGVLWKHVDMFSDTSEVRRSRRLVISSEATAGLKGAQTIDRRLDRGVRTIGPLSRGRFRSCSWLWYISCCAV